MAINALTIPTGLFPTSYSGLGEEYEGFAEGKVLPLLQQLMGGGYQKIITDAYGQAQQGLGQYTKTQMQPAVQSTINQLAGRNMLNSSTASDTLAKTMSGIADQSQGYQAQLQGNMAGQLSQYPDWITQLMQMGGTSQSSNPLAPYQTLASLIQGMM